MNTLIQLLIKASGLTNQEAADYLGSRLDTVKSWNCGRNPTPPEMIAKMADLIATIDSSVAGVIEDMPTGAVLTMRVTNSSKKAVKLGWPSLSTYNEMLGRLAVKAIQNGHPIRIEPL